MAGILAYSAATLVVPDAGPSSKQAAEASAAAADGAETFSLRNRGKSVTKSNMARPVALVTKMLII